MRRAVIVIGSNYGDEGKGMAAYSAAKQLGMPCLNILINGGPQRGHTVDLPDGRRHIFHHFGAGSAAGAVSCMDEDFMVNPMVFEQERVQLAAEIPEAELRCLVSARCRVTLPYDMMLNQMLEDARGAQRHGSCGMGVYETRRRYESTPWSLRFGELTSLSETAYVAYCTRIVDEYLPARMASEGLSCPKEWQPILTDKGLMIHSWEDLQSMRMHTELYDDWRKAADGFEHLVFEAAQGLALDEFNQADSPHLTPSRTTSFVSAQRIAALAEPVDTEIVYVTRSYFTRHGAGPLPTACAMTDINPAIVDRTNMPNPYQQTIRYGRFDINAFRSRVFADLAATKTILPDVQAVALVTHLNETGHHLCGNATLDAFSEGFQRVVYADVPYEAKQLIRAL